jgi:hypothetical protein
LVESPPQPPFFIPSPPLPFPIRNHQHIPPNVQPKAPEGLGVFLPKNGDGKRFEDGSEKGDLRTRNKGLLHRKKRRKKREEDYYWHSNLPKTEKTCLTNIFEYFLRIMKSLKSFQMGSIKFQNLFFYSRKSQTP